MSEAGTYNVNVSKTGYETNTTSVTIVVGQEKLLDIELKPVSGGEGKGGISGMALVGIAVVVIAVVAAVALMLLRRKKAGPDLGERRTQGPEQKPET